VSCWSSRYVSSTHLISYLEAYVEDFVAMFVGQAPMVYPIFRRRFWDDSVPSYSAPKSAEASYEMGKMSKTSKKSKDPFSISRIVGGTTVGGSVMDATRSESQERIVDRDGMPLPIETKLQRRGSKGFIEVKQEFDVESRQGHLRPQMPWDSSSNRWSKSSK
jgi:hypothetical protein